MTSLALTFNDVNFNPVAQPDGQIWLTSAELAKALGYSRTDKVSSLYNAHKDEFTEKMTLTLEMGVNGINGSTRKKLVRIFSLRGCHLLSMFARTDIAKKFRVWVLNILDKKVGQPVIEPIIDENQLSTTTDRKPLVKAVNMLVDETGAIYSNVWKMVHQQFYVTDVNQLTKAQVKEAIEYIHSLFLQAVRMKKPDHSVYIKDMLSLGREKIEANFEALKIISKAMADLDCGIDKLKNSTNIQYSIFESLKCEALATR